MIAPEMRKAANAGERAAFQTTNNRANNTSISKKILAEHYCYCRPGFACDLCLEWRRLQRRFEALRILSQAQSFRRQASCQIGGAL